MTVRREGMTTQAGHADDLRERAIGLALRGAHAEAEAFYRATLQARPDDIAAWNGLGVSVWHLGRTEEALDIYHHALNLAPGDPSVLTNLGLSLQAMDRRAEAEECYIAALAREPKLFHARMNLGVVISDRGDFEGAHGHLHAAFEQEPGSAEAVHNLTMNLVRLGRWSEAIDHYERGLALHPDKPELHRNLSFALLACGDYARGWREHEWRLRCTPHPGCQVNRPLWLGEPLPDRTILLHFEQGHGDTLQFIRYARLVKERVGRVVVLCRQPLVRLISRCEGVDLAFDGSGGFEPECHVQAPLMSLPCILGTTLETIPGRVPYLFAEPAQVERWRPVLDAIRATHANASGRPLLVGVGWQGHPDHRADRWRSYPLAGLAPIAEVPSVRLISLQVGHGTEQLAALEGRFPVTLLPGRKGRDFAETAAIASQLDLVITPDSALAHLSGGLGVPVWVPTSSAADYRWHVDRTDSPWYPTMRLFRQTRLNDWDGVFGRMAAELRAASFVAGSTPSSSRAIGSNPASSSGSWHESEHSARRLPDSIRT